MTQHTSRRSPVRRFALPVVTLALGATVAVYGEPLLSTTPEAMVGDTLTPALATGMAVAGCGVLFIVTLLMAIFPGTPRHRPDHDEDLSPVVHGPEPHPTGDPAAEGVPAPDGAPEETCDPTPPTADRPQRDDLVRALRESASQSARARQAAEEGRARAEARADELAQTLATLRDGTSNEAKAMAARIREEATREAMLRVRELGESTDRLTAALREARQRAEDDREQAVREAQDREAALIDAHHIEVAHLQRELDAAHAEIISTRREATVDEFQRIQVAITAINDTHVDILDPMQRHAVERHQDRLREAMRRLDPTRGPDFGPALPLPPLAEPDQSSEPPVQGTPAVPTATAAPRRGRRKGRRSAGRRRS